MTLSVTNVGDNPQQPSIQADAYIPDRLIAGNLKLVTDSVTIKGGASDLVRGSVLGQITTGSTATAVAGSNTGNGVMGAITVGSGAIPGVYVLKVTKAAANAGDFEVIDPQGDVMGVGTVGVAFNTGGLSFTLADGATDFIVNDSFNITVAVGSLKYVLATAAAIDGSAVPVAILADYAAASGGDVTAGIYLMGEFNGNYLTLGAGITLAAAKAALSLRSIFIKTSVSAADPT
jgi:hypothetical protein